MLLGMRRGMDLHVAGKGCLGRDSCFGVSLTSGEVAGKGCSGRVSCFGVSLTSGEVEDQP